MPALIDAHCHLDFIIFDKDRDEVLQRAQKNNIDNIIIPSVSRNNWGKIQSLCEQNKNLHACYGLHPYWIDQHQEQDLNKLRQQLDNTTCVGVGECGLDYRPEQGNKDKQLYFFKAQLKIANDIKKPVVIHAVRATEVIIQQLQPYTELRGMIHSFSGSYEQALQLIKMGFYISLSGSLTYKKANKLRTITKKLPLSSLLIETDAPDQAPSSHNNERNEPSYLTETLTALCQLRDETKYEIINQLRVNTKELFNLS